MKTTALQLRNSANWSHIRLAFLLIPLGCFALSPQAQAVCEKGCLTNANTVLGEDALVNGGTGLNNTAIGSNALHDNMGSFFLGDYNTATGAGALASNTTGSGNTGTGDKALEFNTTGRSNTAIGQTALFSNTTGNSNIAVGSDALFNNITGSSNIALGLGAGLNLTTGDNNIDIGNQGVVDESNTIRIGTQGTQARTFIAGIAGAGITGSPVMITGSGRLGTAPSSERFKQSIRPMDKASEAILALDPVTFRYKKEIDPDCAAQFGLIAEDVEKVNPDLVARDADGKAFTVRYDAVNAMLLNEFLKEHKTVQEQGATITGQRKDFEAALARQQKQIEALTAGLQKVSARLELNKFAPQTAKNTD